MEKDIPKHNRRNFLSAFTTGLAEGMTDIADELRTNAQNAPPYADKAAFQHRCRSLLEHAHSDGIAMLDRDVALRRQKSSIPRYHGHCIAQGSLETALACLEFNREPELASRITNAVLDRQVRDSGHPDYGNFFWMEHWKEVADKNAIHFMVPNLVALLDRGDRLEPEVQQRLTDALPAAHAALSRHRVPWPHTHMRLLEIWSLLLCGQCLPDDAAQDESKARWDEWFSKTAEVGITEFNSPCYSAIALFALEGLWEAVPAGTWRREIELILDYFTYEVLIHTHPFAWTLSGAMSREPSGHLDGDGWTTFYLHRQLGARRPHAWTVWAMNFLLRSYRTPRWLHSLCWKRELPYDVTEDHPHHTRHAGGPTRCRLRMDALAAVGSHTGAFNPPDEVPFLLTYPPPEKASRRVPRYSIAAQWRSENADEPPAWRDWRVSVASDQTMLDTLLLLSFEPKVEEPRRIAFVFSCGRSDQINLYDHHDEEMRDHFVPWPREYRVYTSGPAIGIWVYEPVDARNTEPQTYSIDAEVERETRGENRLVLSTRCTRPLIVPVLIAARHENRSLPTDPPIANMDRTGKRITCRISVPQTGTLVASYPPTVSSDPVLHRSRYLTLRPGVLARLAEKKGRLRDMITNITLKDG